MCGKTRAVVRGCLPEGDTLGAESVTFRPQGWCPQAPASEGSDARRRSSVVPIGARAPAPELDPGCPERPRPRTAPCRSAGAETTRGWGLSVPRAARPRSAVPRPGRVGSPVLLHLDRRPSALVSERLVVGARYHVQMRVMRYSTRFGESVPEQHVAVGSEALVLRTFRGDEELVHRAPLLGREFERREAMLDRDDYAAPRQHAVRVTGIARGRIDAPAFSMNTSASRNCVRSQKTQALSLTCAFSRTTSRRDGTVRPGSLPRQLTRRCPCGGWPRGRGAARVASPRPRLRCWLDPYPRREGRNPWATASTASRR